MLNSRFSTHIKTLLVSASLVLTMSAPLLAADYVSVKGDGINVRTGPGTNYKVSMELFDGYPLKVVATQGDWFKVVDYENDTGWIHSSVVENGNTEIVNGTESVNMRAEASTNSAVVATVDRGVVMTKLESKGQWVKLKHASGVVGWMYKPLLWP